MAALVTLIAAATFAGTQPEPKAGMIKRLHPAGGTPFTIAYLYRDDTPYADADRIVSAALRTQDDSTVLSLILETKKIIEPPYEPWARVSWDGGRPIEWRGRLVMIRVVHLGDELGFIYRTALDFVCNRCASLKSKELLEMSLAKRLTIAVRGCGSAEIGRHGRRGIARYLKSIQGRLRLSAVRIPRYEMLK